VLPLSRPEALSLLREWVISESLRRHVLAVEAAMRAYAQRFDEDQELWGQTGLLHDLDYERYPDLATGHPRHAVAELRRLGYPEVLVRGVASHADFMGVPRESSMELTLFAVDELCGFISACAYVRPAGIAGMTPKSVNKKVKQPSFAAAISREDLRRGAEGLRIGLDEHVAFVISALQPSAHELGLEGRGSDAQATRPAGGAAGPSAGATPSAGEAT